MTVPTFKVNQGDEIEISYQLDYKMAEVKRLSNPQLFSHVTTTIHSATTMPPASSTSHFTTVTDTTAVTVDDQRISLKTRVINIPLELHADFKVTALYNDGSGQAASGEAPVDLLMIHIQRPGFERGQPTPPASPNRV
jgi:hypothetical protein